MNVTAIYPAGFKIRSMRDAKLFCEKYLCAGIHDVPDCGDKTLYHRILKDANGTVSMGDAHYGPDPLTAEIPCCGDDNIVARIYKIRKSVNKRFFH